MWTGHVTLDKSLPSSNLSFFVYRMGTRVTFTELMEENRLGLAQQPARGQRAAYTPGSEVGLGCRPGAQQPCGPEGCISLGT